MREAVPRNVQLLNDGKLFAHRILDVLCESLIRRRVPDFLWSKLLCISEMLIFWCFPDSHLGHRTCSHLEILFAVVFASKGLLWIRARHWTDQAKRVLRMLHPAESHVLSYGCGSDSGTNLAFLQKLADRQRLLIDGPPVLFGLYQWWSDSWRYVGIGKHQRKMHQNQGSLSRRFLEHMCGTIRSTYRDGFKLRYMLARRVAPWSCFFLVCSSGSEAFIRACESVECKVHQPRSNGGSSAPKNRRTKHRTRPAKHLRHAAVPRVSPVFERCVDKRYCFELRRICSRVLTEGAETSHVDFWTLPHTYCNKRDGTVGQAHKVLLMCMHTFTADFWFCAWVYGSAMWT